MEGSPKSRIHSKAEQMEVETGGPNKRCHPSLTTGQKNNIKVPLKQSIKSQTEVNKSSAIAVTCKPSVQSLTKVVNTSVNSVNTNQTVNPEEEVRKTSASEVMLTPKVTSAFALTAQQVQYSEE